jgi:type IV pilus assembly protein PilE
MKKGFTLLELIIVVIIMGILASLGFTQYTKMVEKGRTAEARSILGQLRSAQYAYFLDYGGYGGAISYLAISYLSVAAPTSCVSTNYFNYTTVNNGLSTAIRCTASGKAPQSITLYSLTLGAGGGWGGTSGYY